MNTYLLIGLGVHLGASAASINTFKNASTKSMLIGFIACLLAWPIGLFIISLNRLEDN